MAKSIEETLAELNANIVALTEVIGGALSGKASVAEVKKTAEDKPKATRTRATAAPKKPTQAEMKKAAETFLDAAKDNEDDYNNRRAHLKTVVAKFDAPKFTEIGEDDRADAIEALNDYTAEESDNDI